MQYETVAEAYRDLERASGRLALVDRLATLLAGTPAELLPVVCYLCQGLIAPEFAGVDLGLAEKLAVRAVATATGASPAAGRRAGPGDRRPGPGRRATAGRDRRRPAGQPDGHRRGGHVAPDRRGRGAGVAGPQAGPAGRAAGPGHPAGGPLPAAPGHQGAAAGHRHADHPGRAGPGVHRRAGRPAGAGTRLQHLLRPGPGRRRPGRRRPGGGRADPRPPGQPGAGHAGPAAVRGRPDPGQAGRAVLGRVQVRRRPGPGAPYRRRGNRAVHPAAGARVRAVPRRRGEPRRRARARARRSSRARSSPTTRPLGSCTRSARSCSGGASTASTRPCWTCRWGCSASSCSTPTART